MSNKVCFESLRKLLVLHEERLSLFTRTELQEICELVRANEECREKVWLLLEHFLSNPVPDRGHQDVLMETGAIVDLILYSSYYRRQHDGVSSLRKSESDEGSRDSQSSLRPSGLVHRAPTTGTIYKKTHD